MSRIGKRELVIPEGVEVKIENNTITATSSKGTLSLSYDKLITVKEVDGKIRVERKNDNQKDKVNKSQGDIRLENQSNIC